MEAIRIIGVLPVCEREGAKTGAANRHCKAGHCEEPSHWAPSAFGSIAVVVDELVERVSEFAASARFFSPKARQKSPKRSSHSSAS